MQFFNTNHSPEGKKKKKMLKMRVLEIGEFQLSAPYGPENLPRTEELLAITGNPD